jgi:hypothetical protein
VWRHRGCTETLFTGRLPSHAPLCNSTKGWHVSTEWCLQWRNTLQLVDRTGHVTQTLYNIYIYAMNSHIARNSTKQSIGNWLSVTQVVKKFATFYETRRSISCSLGPILNEMNLTHTLTSYFFRHTLILLSHLHLGFPNGPVPSRLLTKVVYISRLTHAFYMLRHPVLRYITAMPS